MGCSIVRKGDGVEKAERASVFAFRAFFASTLLVGGVRGSQHSVILILHILYCILRVIMYIYRDI